MEEERRALVTAAATKFKGHPNRAKDYVRDVERWAGHAKNWLTDSDPQGAMNALSNAHAAILAAMEYIRTGVEVKGSTEEAHR